MPKAAVRRNPERSARADAKKNDRVLKDLPAGQSLSMPHYEDPWVNWLTEGDKVWVAFDKHRWNRGVVIGQIIRFLQGQQVLHYRVRFRGDTIASFNPRAGKIKPDNEETRELLVKHGLIPGKAAPALNKHK
ncbi:hypothetical protein GLOTRDRAFT_90531 [Gloeophyllum trabeum ATCC 11539]|uniref:Uncharacterized protein n=1 Tax=Gloeophyllum trabeum (strain ATCC 11539 / FP-39264 / Madison 617) TaxID=670483 RepID=S7QP74_GLOTA|nr:uncharacterized protein GLOTRDRAFT_90531 [Gloeophyllum trabeum ATCC 11539]EPQ61328.1 hypothetical protein GLOTRDRAFT_90531 [Gloeophyllum trabeum ATCC 11539]